MQRPEVCFVWLTHHSKWQVFEVTKSQHALAGYIGSGASKNTNEFEFHIYFCQQWGKHGYFVIGCSA